MILSYSGSSTWPSNSEWDCQSPECDFGAWVCVFTYSEVGGNTTLVAVGWWEWADGLTSFAFCDATWWCGTLARWGLVLWRMKECGRRVLLQGGCWKRLELPEHPCCSFQRELPWKWKISFSKAPSSEYRIPVVSSNFFQNFVCIWLEHLVGVWWF